MKISTLFLPFSRGPNGVDPSGQNPRLPRYAV